MAAGKRRRHYSPQLDRFVVKALYFEAKHQGKPMTRLADEIMLEGLLGSEGWRSAEQSLPDPPKTQRLAR